MSVDNTCKCLWTSGSIKLSLVMSQSYFAKVYHLLLSISHSKDYIHVHVTCKINFALEYVQFELSFKLPVSTRRLRRRGHIGVIFVYEMSYDLR